MLKQILTATLLIVLGHTLAFSFQGDGVWQSLNSPEGRFNILVPGKPEVEMKEIDSDVGKLTQHSYSSSNSTGYFLVAYADYPVDAPPADQSRVLDAVRDGVIKGLNAELISHKSISLNGYAGREFTAKRAVQGSEYVFNWRIFLVGKRLYQLAVVTSPKESASADVTKFLTSFGLNK